jgi:hypothetical protein
MPVTVAPAVAIVQGGAGTSGYAVASIICGVVWICGLGSLIAVLLALIALNDTRDGRRESRTLAWIGLALGVIGMLAPVVLLLGIGPLTTATSSG